MSNTTTIARNAGWFSIETVVGNVVGLFTSIAIARTLGPLKNGYLVYVSYIAFVVSSLGGLGIPATTRKYMAEFIGMGDRGTARFIYWRTLLLQAALASLAAAGLLFWVIGRAPEEYRLASILIVLSIWPAMVNSISSQANAAAEDLSANMPASVISAMAYFSGIAATVVLKWGVVGIGASLLTMRSVDFLVRFFPTFRRVLAWKATHRHPPELRRRMIAFAWQSVVSLSVAIVVWNRSEVVLLGKFCADMRQVAYYSVAFSMADQLLQGATIFGSAAGATIFAQFGRDRSRLPGLAATAFRYLALSSIPLHFIAAALAVPALLLVYGSPYSGAAMVVTLAPLLCLPKAFVGPAQNLLESNERQRYVIVSTVLAAIVDISVAWYLIPAHGAVGACIGSGAAQLTAVGLMWAIGIRFYKVKLPWLQAAKIAFAGAMASLTAHYIAVLLPPLWGILCGGSASLIVLFGLFYGLRILEPEDSRRIKTLADMLPKPIARPVEKIALLLIRIPTPSPTPAKGACTGTPLVLMIAYHFPPDNAIGGARPYRFYKYLKRLGYECHIVTAAVQEADAPADIEYVPDPLDSEPGGGFARHLERVGKKFLLDGSLKLAWSASAFVAGRSFLKRRKDREIVILSSSPPVATHLAGMALAAWFRRRWIADFRDPIVGASTDPPFVRQKVAVSLAWLIMKRADLALANTDAMQQAWNRRFPGFNAKTQILWNGFDPEDSIQTYALPHRERKVLSHVGELYGGRDLRPILHAAAQLYESGGIPPKSVVFRQVGVAEPNGLPDPELLQAALSEGWLDIKEPVPANQARAMALDSDGLLLIQPQSALQVPAKLFEYLRLGRPILAYVMRDSPTARILQRAGIPFECIFPEHDPEEIQRRLLRFIAQLDGQPMSHSQWFSDSFDASRQVGALDTLIRSLTAQEPASGRIPRHRPPSPNDLSTISPES